MFRILYSYGFKNVFSLINHTIIHLSNNFKIFEILVFKKNFFSDLLINVFNSSHEQNHFRLVKFEYSVFLEILKSYFILFYNKTFQLKTYRSKKNKKSNVKSIFPLHIPFQDIFYCWKYIYYNRSKHFNLMAMKIS